MSVFHSWLPEGGGGSEIGGGMDFSGLCDKLVLVCMQSGSSKVNNIDGKNS